MSKPKGTSLIDHKIRHALSLSCEEYVMADLICRYNKSHKLGTLNYNRYVIDIGFNNEEVVMVGKKLIEKGILAKGAKRIETTDIWNVYFNTDSQFEQLWKIHPIGIKQKARIAFLRSIQEVPYETLLEKLQEYVKSKEGNDFVMHLFTFLDIKNKCWENDFEVKIKAKENNLILGS